MNYIKKSILILALISLLLSIITINTTYAKYQSNVDAEADIKVARWHILVNNWDIKNNNTAKKTITPTFTGSEHIKEGVIAPTSEGYFDIIIDSTNVDVSFTYEITLATDETSNVKDFIVTSYTLNNSDPISINNNETIKNTINKTNNIKTTTLRVYVKWNDGENSTMNNQEDTSATIEGNNTAKLSVKLNFKQVV